MSDGTTAVQVSPIPTESEMASIRQIFTNVANALVQASELSKTVDELKAKFDTLDHDYRTVMARNDELVQSLSEVRSQRDAAQTELAQVKDEAHSKAMEIQRLSDSNAVQAQTNHNLREELSAAKNDYSNAMQAWHEAEARADGLASQLANIKKALGIVDPPMTPPPQPDLEPMPVGVAPNEPKADPSPEPYEPPPYWQR